MTTGNLTTDVIVDIVMSNVSVVVRNPEDTIP